MFAGVLNRNPLGYWGIPGNTPRGEAPTPFMATWDRWVPRYRRGSIADFSHMGSFVSPFNDGSACVFWQYTDGGNVDGVPGNVDRSVASFDNEAALIAWVGPAPGV